jgi:hypothetical protein
MAPGHRLVGVDPLVLFPFSNSATLSNLPSWSVSACGARPLGRRAKRVITSGLPFASASPSTRARWSFSK